MPLETCPHGFNVFWLSVQMVGLYKTQEQEDVRPLGLINSLIRVFDREVISQNRLELREHLEPQQLARG